MTRMNYFWLAIVIGCATLVTPAGADNCKNIKALIVDSSAPNGCTSPYGFCAAGTVHGNHDLNGTTYFVLDGVSSPPRPLPAGVSPPVC